MNLATLPPRFPTPDVRSTQNWAMRARDMTRDPRMVCLAHGIWARWYDHAAPETLEPWLDLLLNETGTWTPWGDRPAIALPAPRKAKPLPGMHLRRLQAPPSTQPGPWRSRATGAVETLLVLQDWLRGWRSVVAVDHVLAKNLSPIGEPEPLQPADLKLQVESLPAGTRGKRLLAQAVERSAPNVWSPMETVLRLVVEAAGFPAGEHNVPVDLGQGRRVYLDLAWRTKLVALEYNGAVHYRDRAAYSDEMGRLNALQDQGWSVRVVVLEDLRNPARREALVRWLRTRL